MTGSSISCTVVPFLSCFLGWRVEMKVFLVISLNLESTSEPQHFPNVPFSLRGLSVAQETWKKSICISALLNSAFANKMWVIRRKREPLIRTFSEFVQWSPKSGRKQLTTAPKRSSRGIQWSGRHGHQHSITYTHRAGLYCFNLIQEYK